jgi:hypothetical protein
MRIPLRDEVRAIYPTEGPGWDSTRRAATAYGARRRVTTTATCGDPVRDRRVGDESTRGSGDDGVRNGNHVSADEHDLRGGPESSTVVDSCGDGVIVLATGEDLVEGRLNGGAANSSKHGAKPLDSPNFPSPA